MVVILLWKTFYKFITNKIYNELDIIKILWEFNFVYIYLKKILILISKKKISNKQKIISK